MENNEYSESEEFLSPWLFKVPETLPISETTCQPLIPIQSSEQTLLTTGESQPLPSPKQFVRETYHQISPIVSQPLTSIQGDDKQTLLMAGQSQPPQGKTAKKKKIVGESREPERRARKREIDKQYRQRLKLKQQEDRTEKEELGRTNKELKLEIGQLKGEIQEKEQEIEQLKKEHQENEQKWRFDLQKCADGFGQLKQGFHEKEQLLRSMQDNEKRLKSMLETLEADANDKLLKSRSCSCSCGQQRKTDAIETDDLQIKSERAQIRNERNNLSEQVTVFKKILTGMDEKIRFYYYEGKEAGWISFGKKVFIRSNSNVVLCKGGNLNGYQSPLIYRREGTLITIVGQGLVIWMNLDQVPLMTCVKKDNDVYFSCMGRVISDKFDLAPCKFNLILYY